MRGFLDRLVSAAASLLDLALPRRCVGCAGPDGAAGLCPRCRPGAGEDVRVWAGDLAVVAATVYDGPVREALLAYKERGRRDLAGALSELLADALGAQQRPPGAVLVPVPSARAVAAARGGDHVARLARRAGAVHGLQVCRVLRPVRPVCDSAGLGAAERRRNLNGSMAAAGPPPPGAVAVLVDDIVTSGATLAEAARALGAAGWPVAGAVTVAATPRRTAAAWRAFTERHADPLAGPRQAV